MKSVYFLSFKILKRDLLLALLAILLLAAGIVCRVDAYEQTLASAISWKVANRVVVIDPGHGGIDPGAIGKTGTLEKEVVLQIAQQLKTLFSNAGAVVIMTREKDTDLGDPKARSIYSRKQQDLAKRVEVANKNKADIYLSIHLNSFPSSQWRGAQTFYLPHSEKSKRLAETIQEEIKAQLGNTKREALAEDFFTTQNTTMPAVIIELGFLSNPEEEQLLKDKEYQDKMARAIYTGVARYFVSDKTKDSK